LKKNIVKCHCGTRAMLRPASVIHGNKAKEKYLYICSRYPACDSYVGVHKKTLKPLGTLADKELRAKRIQAHQIFNRLWESGLMKKWQAYKWMAGKFGLNNQQAHIAKFSNYMCNELIALCEKSFQNNKLAS
jgi:hypothetical protein